MIVINYLLDNISMIVISITLFLSGIFLIKYAIRKKPKIEIKEHTANQMTFKEKSFKISLQQSLEYFEASLQISNKNFSIIGDTVVDIPFDKIINISFPYALNTVICTKNKIIHSRANNFYIGLNKLMSSFSITFFDENKRIVTFNILMQESKRNFRINKIARIEFLTIVKTIRGQLSDGTQGDG